MSKERERCQIKEVFDHISGNQATLNQLYLIILQETRPRSTNCIRSYYRRLGHAQPTVFDHITGNQATLLIQKCLTLSLIYKYSSFTFCSRLFSKMEGQFIKLSNSKPYPIQFFSNFIVYVKVFFGLMQQRQGRN